MRSEIGVEPWAPYFEVYLDGEKLEMCTMADEEAGCAEVYADWELTEKGGRRLLSDEKRMVFGHVEERPLTLTAEKIKAEPQRAQEIWDEHLLESREKYGY